MEGVNVAICTIEKANSIVNRLAEEKRLEVSAHLEIVTSVWSAAAAESESSGSFRFAFLFCSYIPHLSTSPYSMCGRFVAKASASVEAGVRLL